MNNSIFSNQDNFTFRMMAVEGNEEMLKGTIYTQILDLAAVLVTVPKPPVLRSGNKLPVMSVCVNEQMLKELELTKTDAINIAIKNMETEGTHLSTIYSSIDEEIKRLMPIPEGITPIIDDVPPLHIVTNELRYLGANAIMNKHVLDRYYSKLGNIYILPSSRHEILICPESIAELNMVKDMVKGINCTEVKEVDKLTDTVYLYDGIGLKTAI